MSRLIATGDSHIGAGRDLAPDRLAEQEQVWRQTLELARDEGADVVLHGGDLWERRKPSPDEMLAAERPLVEHKAAGGCPVLIVAGNHDRAGVDDQLALRVLEQAGLITLSTEPETFNSVGGTLVRDLSVPGGTAICTLPWTPVSRLVAAQDGGDRDSVYRDAADLLLMAARSLRDTVEGPAVLVLHWSISGASLPSGLPIEMAREVILDLGELEALGFQAIVCAHIHRRQRLDKMMPYPAWYVGSPMPLSFGEANDDHGVWILSDDPWAVEFRPIESRRFVTLEGDGAFGAQIPAGAFVKVRGAAGDVDVPLIRAELLAAGASRVWFDLESERVVRDRGATVDGSMSPVDALAAYLAANGHNGTLDALVERGKAYLEATS